MLHILTRRSLLYKILTPLVFGGDIMPRAGLNKQSIIREAIRLIEEEGCPALTMRELAKRLNVQAASLYNHVESMDEILAEVGTYAIASLNNHQFSAIAGLSQDAAVFALADAYRQFAKEHPALYQVIMSLHRTNKAIIENTAHPITAPFMQVLAGYPLDREQAMHWQRILRSILHGFLSQEEAGYFCHFPIDQSRSFELAIQCYIDGLHAAVKKEAQASNEHGE